MLTSEQIKMFSEWCNEIVSNVDNKDAYNASYFTQLMMYHLDLEISNIGKTGFLQVVNIMCRARFSIINMVTDQVVFDYDCHRYTVTKVGLNVRIDACK